MKSWLMWKVKGFFYIYPVADCMCLPSSWQIVGEVVAKLFRCAGGDGPSNAPTSLLIVLQPGNVVYSFIQLFVHSFIQDAKTNRALFILFLRIVFFFLLLETQDHWSCDGAGTQLRRARTRISWKFKTQHHGF